jgi:hypothetical protein
MAQMRGPFPFPPTAPQQQGVPGIVQLQSGGIYTVPPGEYLVIPGQQTVLEFWDPLGNVWRGTQCYQGQVEQISSDGTNYRLVNLSGVAVGANITNAGSGGTNGIGPNATGSTVTFGAPASGGVTTTAQGYVIVGGTVAAPTVTQGGSGFLVPPAVFCDPPPVGGVQATFTSTISSAGVITAVTQVNAGAGYTAVPQFYIAPQPMFYQGAIRFPGDTAQTVPAPGLIHPNNVWGASPYQPNISSTLGALLTAPAAVGGSGTLTALIMTYYGSGYTGSTLPAITFGGTSLGAAAATAIMAYCLIGGPITGASGTVYIVGAPAITTLGLVSSTNVNNIFTPRPGRGKVTNATGPVFTIEDPGFGIQSAGTGVTIGGGSMTAIGNVPAANLGGATDVSILQAMVQ